MAEKEATRVANGAGSPTASIVPNISQSRLQVIIAGLWFCLFLSALDTTIVTTALISISSGFNALEQGAWLITAYLLPYGAFLMITAKLSDTWGLKSLILSCAAMFLVFSMACGGAQSMVQLIIFRALQGIGGSGLYSLTFVTIMKVISPEKIGFYSGVISSVFAMANLLGPLLGGTISDQTTWRWIFFMNGPIIIVAIVLLFLSMPTLQDGKTNSERLHGLDGIGGLLSVCWPIPLLFALQEAGGSYAWSSGVIIGTLVAGSVLLIVFILYETWFTYRTQREPIFPMRFLCNPAMALILLSMFLLGMPFYVVFVQLPQRFQVVNFTSAERAGILLLPATVVSPVGAMVGGLAAKKIPIEFVLIFAIVVICVGTGLLSSLPTDSRLWPGVYGYEIITGLGLGLASPPYFMLVATTVTEKDVSVATGALNMMRTFGGAVAVAVCTTVHREYFNDKLPEFLTLEQIVSIRDSSVAIARLPEEVRDRVGGTFGRSYNRQFQVVLAFTGLNLIVAITLSIVRQRLGVFGTMPVRKEENEFMRAEGRKKEELEKGLQVGPLSHSCPATNVEPRSHDISAEELDNKKAE